MLLFLESIGIGEIVLVLFFVLLFFGADSLPTVARKLGRGIRQVKDISNDLQDEITKATTDMRREMNANKAIKETKEAIENPSKEITRRLRKTGSEITENLNQSVRLEDKNKTNHQPKSINVKEETHQSE